MSLKMLSPSSLLVVFLTLTKNERQLMEAVVGGNFGIDETGLKVVRLLKRILTIPLDITMMFNGSYNCHLTLISYNDRFLHSVPYVC